MRKSLPNAKKRRGDFLPPLMAFFGGCSGPVVDEKEWGGFIVGVGVGGGRSESTAESGTRGATALSCT